MFRGIKNKTAHLRYHLLVSAVLFLFLLPISIELDTDTYSFTLSKAIAFGGIIEAAQSAISVGMLGLGSGVAWLAGKLFDSVFLYSVVEIGSKLNSTLGIAIQDSWKVVRDICNLAFIFGFIYTGFQMIFNPASANARRFFIKMITGALLINFSLYFVKVIIDISNSFSVQIYNAIVQSGTLSEALFNTLGLVTIYQSDKGILAGMSEGIPITFGFFGMIFLFITAFVFFTVAVLLITRLVGLILIMIGSPLLFAAPLFPQTQYIADDMWKKLINYAFFVPVYLVSIFIVLNIVNGLGLNIANFANEINGEGASNIPTIMNFCIVIFLMWSSISIAEKAGIAGGKTMSSLGNTIRGHAQQYIGNSTAGVSGAVLRSTLGKRASRLSEDDTLLDSASKRGVGGWVARRRLSLNRTLADASFDVRNTPGNLGNTLGSGRKGGYQTIKKEITAKEEAYAKSLGTLDDTDMRVQARKKEFDIAERQLKDDKETLDKAKRLKEAAETDKRKIERENDKTQLEIDKLESLYLTETDLNKRIEIRKKIDEKKNIIGINDAQILKIADEISRVLTPNIVATEKKVKDGEEAVTTAKTKHEQEKNRRQIGSSYVSAEVQKELEKLQTSIDTEKTTLKTKWKAYENEIKTRGKGFTDAERLKMMQELKELEEKVKEKEDARKEFLRTQKDRGYASVLETSNIVTAGAIGRLPHQEHIVGEAIRKAYSKGIPKEKE